jgi:hypothetical protein
MNTDFSLPEDDSESEDPLEKFERLRKERESETLKMNKTKIITDQYSEPSAQAAVSIVPQQLQSQNQTLPLLAPRPQEYIIKQEDIVKYRESESNLFIFSGDRNWLLNRNENRYRFTINFNKISNTNDNTFSPSVQSKFKNITRIELVKAILSAESLEVAPNKSGTSRISNLLSYPYLMVNLDEWSSNSYGTNTAIDNCFAIIQYDQIWRPIQSAGAGVSDIAGYISLTPRYLKSQRVYHPTPLATLQKLSFTVERPDGKQLSTQLDTMDIDYIYFDPTRLTNNRSTYSTNDKSWIFIKTTSYFNQFFALQGDRIIIQGYQLPTSSNVTQIMANDVNTFINNPDGHLVIGIAYNDTGTSDITDGANSVGYANYIIIRSRFTDPTMGSTDRDYLGGNSTNETYITGLADTYKPNTPCAMLNINKQSHFVLRIITREMDSVTNIRPDNS